MFAVAVLFIFKGAELRCVFYFSSVTPKILAKSRFIIFGERTTTIFIAFAFLLLCVRYLAVLSRIFIAVTYRDAVPSVREYRLP